MLVLQVVVDTFLNYFDLYINVFFILTTACHQCAIRSFLFYLNVGCLFLLFYLFFDVHEWSCLAGLELSRRALPTWAGKAPAGAWELLRWSLSGIEFVTNVVFCWFSLSNSIDCPRRSLAAWQDFEVYKNLV